MQHTGSRRRGVNLVLVVPALLLSGCGGSDDSGASASNRSAAPQVMNDVIDPCALVTSTEATEALGVATVEADRPSEANTETRSKSYSGGEDTVVRLKTCRYTGESGQTVAVLTVMVRQSTSPAEAEIGFESLRKTYAETAGVTDVPGLGEQAFWMENPRGLQVLDRGLQLSISGDTDAGKARDLAVKALGRLK